MRTDPAVVKELEDFIASGKFKADEMLHYQGLGAEHLKTTLTDTVNEAARDFIRIVQCDPSETKFQDQIAIALRRFDPFVHELDTDDHDRVCLYFEELMDIVGLESSGGHLMSWRYGFEPDKT